jgi:hypothetical protein
MSQATVKRGYWLRHYLDDLTLRVSAVFVLAFVVMPPDGLGIDLCLCKRFTGAPCPACGMTRSCANMVRGEFVRAVEYHPFGPFLVPVFACLGFLALAPRRWRVAVRDALLPRAERFRPLYQLTVAVFVSYGLVRWGLVFAGFWQFPATWP